MAPVDCAGIFDEFTEILSRRIEEFGEGEGLFCLSEDTICAYLAAAYVIGGVQPHLIEMEVVHPELRKQKGMQSAVDIVVRENGRRIWTEVKFDRCTRSNSMMNVTNRFGNLINDMLRVGLIKEGCGHVAYITDNRMHQYLHNNSSQFVDACPFSIDEAFLRRLPPSASRRIRDSVRSKISASGISVALLRTRKIGDLCCYLYQVSPTT